MSRRGLAAFGLVAAGYVESCRNAEPFIPECCWRSPIVAQVTTFTVLEVTQRRLRS